MLFTLLEPRIDRLIRESYQAAVRLLGLWLEEDNCKTLREALINLEDVSTRLLKSIPSRIANKSNLGRHVDFLGYWLNRDNKKSCTSDILDICLRDLPELQNLLLVYSSQQWNLDNELVSRTGELIEMGKFPEVIRNVFLVLTERLRSLKRGVKARDGHALIEELFGDSGRLVCYITNDSRLGMRNLLLGLYSMIRNLHAHHQIEATGPEAVGLVLIADRVIKQLNDIRRIKKRRGDQS